ncbi:MAG: hypothetical protein ABSC26_05270 [Stellaceae bacterium]|jgi:hypothetical protein
MTGQKACGYGFFFSYLPHLHRSAARLPLTFVMLALAACSFSGEPPADTLIATNKLLRTGPATAPYLMGETDEISAGLPCNVAAREVYRLLDGKDRHYLIGWLPDGRAHVVVLSDWLIFDPLFHKTPVPVTQYPFQAISVSEQDGWHLVDLTSGDNANGNLMANIERKESLGWWLEYTLPPVHWMMRVMFGQTQNS